MSVFDTFNLQGRRALITGGSRGLGFAMARALGEAGAELLIAGSDADRLQVACAELAALGLTRPSASPIACWPGTRRSTS